MTKSPREVAAMLTDDQKETAKSNFWLAIGLINEVCPGLSYAAVFNITCAVLEILEGRRL